MGSSAGHAQITVRASAGVARYLIVSLLTGIVFTSVSAPAHALCGTTLIAADRLEKAGRRQSFTVPSSSSFPTIQQGQVVESARVTPGFRPKAGDIVAFAPNTQRTATFLKRVVAVGPATVQMRNGRLFVDGKQIARTGPLSWPTELVETAKTLCVPTDGGRAPGKLYQETLPSGARYRIAECTDNLRGADDTAEITVPAGHYFVLGDNRDNSNDSRFQGPIPGNRITHVATCIRDSIDKSIPLILMILYIALAVLVAVFLGMLLVVWRRRRARKTA